MRINELLIEANDVSFRGIARTRWMYYGRFTDVDQTQIMAMCPIHKVWNKIGFPLVKLKYLTHPVF